MRRFIKRVFIFSCIVLSLIIVVEGMLRQIPNIYEYKQSLVEKKGDGMKNIILGSSVVDCCINPKLIADSTYNLAIAGQWFRYNLAFLEKNLDKMPRLDCIVFGVCYHSFWCDDSPEQDIRSFVSHLIYMDIGIADGLLSYSELLTSGSLSLRKWSKYYIRRKTTMYCDSLGLDHSYHSSERGKTWKDEIPDDANDQTMQLNTSRNMQLFEENCERLNQLAELCEKRKIRMVIVIPPVHSLYGIHSSKEQWKVVDDFLVNLSTRWEHVEYGNYSHDNRFTDEDFYDGNHLNSDIGGTKFSLIVKEDFAL